MAALESRTAAATSRRSWMWWRWVARQRSACFAEPTSAARARCALYAAAGVTSAGHAACIYGVLGLPYSRTSTPAALPSCQAHNVCSQLCPTHPTIPARTPTTPDSNMPACPPGPQNDIMKAVLASSGCAAVLASEEDDEAVVVSGSSGRYVAVFDPLDGSRNIDAAIPTGECSGCG